MSKPIDQERADFEAWFAREIEPSVSYGNPDILRRSYWTAWKARASVQPAGVAQSLKWTPYLRGESEPKPGIEVLVRYARQWPNDKFFFVTGAALNRAFDDRDCLFWFNGRGESMGGTVSHWMHMPNPDAPLYDAPRPVSGEQKAERLSVWEGSMPESNGKTNYTAILHKGDISEGMTIARSEYPDRVRYEADEVRWLIGERDERPDILDYDADKHSGYTPPPKQAAQDVSGLAAFALALIDGALEGGSFDGGDIQELAEKNGLLVKSQREESCGENCGCAEYGFPLECYRVAPALAAHRAQAQGGDV